MDGDSCNARLAGAGELAPLRTKAPHLSLAGETNIAWTYDEASPEVGPIEGRIAFYDEWVDVATSTDPTRANAGDGQATRQDQSLVRRHRPTGRAPTKIAELAGAFGWPRGGRAPSIQAPITQESGMENGAGVAS